ncbi:MAG: type II toxin-antitoxin system VapC family toxin [Burkholderiales bacterium]|nr:type II toxin-antitoxin system VapC family toxin [Anaerolineae bacterium]
MSAFFVDTSVLLKRYLTEIGSIWVLSWILPSSGNSIIVSDLTPVEIFSALAKRRRMKELSARRIPILQNEFMWNFAHEYVVTPIDSSILIQARQLVITYGATHNLRAGDAVQLASAQKAASILSQSITFVSADNDLLKVAAAEGFVIDDPKTHP